TELKLGIRKPYLVSFSFIFKGKITCDRNILVRKNHNLSMGGSSGNSIASCPGFSIEAPLMSLPSIFSTTSKAASIK
ncbi:hypothetical protein, partial [Aetokthonos hydrillicola]|uniref:hypothetical protein n=1 Tax=Aetokthonos hydrillicola TaxID=1550245 RepID=UPI001ABAA132